MKSLQVLALSVFVAATAQADDWPQWMGPKRDNIWREEGIIDSFPQGGPKTVWRTPIAGGYAGPAVAGGKVFVGTNNESPRDKRHVGDRSVLYCFGQSLHRAFQ